MRGTTDIAHFVATSSIFASGRKLYIRLYGTNPNASTRSKRDIQDFWHLKCLCIEIFDNFLLADMKDR